MSWGSISSPLCLRQTAQTLAVLAPGGQSCMLSQARPASALRRWVLAVALM